MESNKKSAEGVISLKDMTLSFGPRAILDKVSFDIGRGEFVAILGPNGAGKTTLFKLLLGLLKPTSGSISVLGAVPHRGDPNIGYAPQHRVLETDLALRARDVVGFGLDGNKWGIGFGSAKRDAMINEVLKEVDAFQFADAPVGKLSGGEQQRLLIAQALITNPKILLLDEPLSNLDISHAQEIVALLAKISASRTVTIMLVSHDINPLLNNIDRVLYVARGHALMGTPDAIITSASLSKLYDAKVEVIRSGDHVFVVGAEI
jgi:zinc/manganese transport system ATP-binding protein